MCRNQQIEGFQGAERTVLVLLLMIHMRTEGAFVRGSRTLHTVPW
jgi:hypothetical protein